jgi:hypothetical protein
MSRFPFVDETELRSVLRKLQAIGAIVEADMR